MNLKEFYVQRVEKSVFYKQHYSVNSRLGPEMPRMLLMYIDGVLCDKIDDEKDGRLTLSDVIKKGIPEFQRDNDKWSRDRQINFVENALSGYRPTIQLYEVVSDSNPAGSYVDCGILDGLQRLTAIAAFMEGEFNVFEDKVSFQFLKEQKLFRSMIDLQIFTFESEIEAAEFYIQLNRGITHSEEDILRAEEFIVRQGSLDKRAVAMER